MKNTVANRHSRSQGEFSAYKVGVLYFISAIGAFFMTLLGIVAFTQSNYSLGIADFLTAMVVALNVIYFWRTGQYKIASHIGITFVGVFFLFLFCTGGAFHTAPLWLYTFPLAASFLVGSRTGAVMGILLLALAMISQLVRGIWPSLAAYSGDLLIRFVPSYLVVLAYAYLYERTTERDRERLKSINQDLDARVDKQTTELRETNRALQHTIEQYQQAQTDLQAAHEQFITVLDGIDASIYVADMTSREIIFANRHIKQLFGDHLEGKKCHVIFRQESRPCDPCTNAMLVDAQGDPASPVVWEGKNRITGRWHINFDRAVRWMDGRVVKLQVAMDVTRLKEAEESLNKIKTELEERVAKRTADLSDMNERLLLEITNHQQTEKALRDAMRAADHANRAKSDFLANMSHELRTPLNHIIGFTELTLDKNFGDLNKIQEDYLTDVVQSSRHLLSLINDILDLSKIETGKMELDASDVDLKAILMNSLVMVKEKALKHGITLNAEIDGVPERIRADERKLKQIVYNILSNAIKFTPNGGEIRLFAGRAENDEQNGLEKFARISVVDNGIGIERKNLERIFEPFVQLDSAINRKYQGTGLGLSLTRKLVELHGGRIWAESEGEGKGSAFRFIIPVQSWSGV